MVPPIKKVVRADLHIGGCILTPQEDGSTYMVYVAQIDLKGNFPKILINIIAKQHGYRPHILEKIMDDMKAKQLKAKK